ncbi:MAG: type I-B CRISPR-associated endonuclease Cas1b [Salinibacter sp.]
MKRSLYLTSSGQLRRKQNTLYLDPPAAEEAQDAGSPKYFPIKQVKEIHVFGEIDINKRVLDYLQQHEIPVHFYNYYAYYIGSFYPREHNVSGHLVLKQVNHYENEEHRLDLARRFVEGALTNLQKVLAYYRNRGKSVADTEEAVGGHLSSLEQTATIEQLMQIEGQARGAYYQAIDQIVDDEDFQFDKRSRRPPQNRMNSLISFGNSLLYTAVLSEIYKTHLDPRIGFLHAATFRRFSLNLDVAEVFKPILVDRLILRLLQKNQLSKGDFTNELNGIHLTDAGRRTFLQEWESRLNETVKHRQLKRSVSYRHLLRLELYKLEKHLIGDVTYQPFVSRW